MAQPKDHRLGLFPMTTSLGYLDETSSQEPHLSEEDRGRQWRPDPSTTRSCDTDPADVCQRPEERSGV